MAFNSNSDNKSVFNEINITPLTDIFLVLLIIMMVVAPSFQSHDTEIKSPEINSGISVEEKNATVSITKEGDMYLNGMPITEVDLTAKLLELKDTLKHKEVLVKADEATKNKEIMKVMRSAQEAEYEKLTVAGEPLSKKQQNELKEQLENISEQVIQ